MNINWEEIEAKLAASLDDKRLKHTYGVAYTAAAIAMAHGADVQKARLAGLLHDCAKSVPSAERLKMCEEAGIAVSDCERKNPSLLHSKLGALLAKTEYGIEDEDILGAIRWHTTGKPEMSVLEQIVYIADAIEPNRDEDFTIDPKIRQAAFIDLDQCCEMVMKNSIDYIIRKGKDMDEMTIAAYNYYKNINEKK